MTLWTVEVSTAIVTMPPLTRRGELGKLVAILGVVASSFVFEVRAL
jgi:hypothetical protein